MAVRTLSNDKPGMTLAMNIIAAQKGTMVKGDIVRIDTANNWTVTSTAAGDDLLECGIVRHVNAASSIATVEFFHFHDCIKLKVSTGGVALGSGVKMGAAAHIGSVVTDGATADEAGGHIVVSDDTTTCHVMFR